MATLKYYLTSLEPNMAQTIFSQSIGGYCSNSLLYPETTLSANVGLYDLNLSLDTPTGGWGQWTSAEYININGEMMAVAPISSGSVIVSQRGSNNIIQMHIAGDVVRANSTKELFNDVLNDNYKQYRCIAVKNVSLETDPSSDQVASDLSVWIEQNSRQADTTIRIALEIPKSQYYTGVSTSRTSLTLTDSSLVGRYPDDFFKDAYLQIGSQGAVIHSFESSTGTFTYVSSFSTSTVNAIYEVLPGPAQRVKSGTVAPVSTSYISPFLSATPSTPVHLSQTVDVSAGDDIYPNYLFYIWVEREIKKGSAGMHNDDFVISVKYDTSYRSISSPPVTSSSSSSSSGSSSSSSSTSSTVASSSSSSGSSSSSSSSNP